jgi:hypothetical protein
MKIYGACSIALRAVTIYSIGLLASAWMAGGGKKPFRRLLEAAMKKSLIWELGQGT